jgi:hypothetical protein
MIPKEFPKFSVFFISPDSLYSTVYNVLRHGENYSSD